MPPDEEPRPLIVPQLQAIQRQFVEQREQALAQLLLMPTGYRLCIHQPTFDQGVFTSDAMVVKATQEHHFLPPGSYCPSAVAREEFAVPVLPEVADG